MQLFLKFLNVLLLFWVARSLMAKRWVTWQNSRDEKWFPAFFLLRNLETFLIHFAIFCKVFKYEFFFQFDLFTTRDDAQHTEFLVVILGHILFLVFIQGHIWFVWFVNSHTRIIYGFPEIIQGSYEKNSKPKSVYFSFSFDVEKIFKNHTMSYMTHKTMIGSTNAR